MDRVRLMEVVLYTTITGTAAAVVQAIADIDTDPTNFNSTLSDSGGGGGCRYCFDFGEQW